MYRKHNILGLFAVLLTICSCSENIIEQGSLNSQQVINLTGQISQQNVTRANDYGFVSGDRMGIFVVDRVGGVTGSIDAVDNRAQNMLFTFDADAGKWSSPTTLYWRDGITAIDVYGYYPGENYIATPSAYAFEVQSDQSTEAANGDLSGYEKSDLLWGKSSDVKPTAETIVIKYSHILAGVRVKLEKGTGITETEWDKLQKIVLVENTITQGTVNLSTGALTVNSGQGTVPVKMMPQSGDEYRAVVIPQKVAAAKQLLSITIDGQTYSHLLDKVMNYQSGKLHNFTMTVNKKENSGDYQITVSDDGISPWINDEVSHQFTTMMYVTVNCAETGKLKESITAAGYDYKTIQNLKVTGELTTEDFKLLREEMPELKHLNLKDVKLKHIMYYDSWWDTGNHDGNLYCDDMMPIDALKSNKNIHSIVLPSSLKVVGDGALCDMDGLMYSTLEIPDGVTRIGGSALAYNEEQNGIELILPASIDSIGGDAFYACGFKCNLKLSDNIRYIGSGAFDRTPNFYGTFHVPSKLKQVDDVFNGLGSNGSFDGELEIPQGIKTVSGAFGISMSKRVVLNLPAGVKKIGRGWPEKGFTSIHFNDDLEEIESECFAWYAMPPDGIKLPKSLVKIGYRAFCENGLPGELEIPENCLEIEADAFLSNQITKLTLPSRLEVINPNTFRGSNLLTHLTIPKYVNYIGESAFRSCPALQTVICLNPEPPTLGKEVFEGLYFDKCVLEVPEQSVELYRHTDGWSDFQNITAYHELAFNIPEIICLDKGVTREGILRAEGDWEVCECPSWVTVSPSSGTHKEELTITINPNTGDTREGKIVFKLKGKDYTTYTTVRQVNSDEYKEDATVTLQTASAGGTAIPLFIVGEGYGAEDIASGKYLTDMTEQMEHLFSIEPYKSYRNYFTVSTAYACSSESGMSGLTKFGSNNDKVWEYAKQHGTAISDSREAQTTILVLCNANAYSNHTDLWDSGLSFSWIGKTDDAYPYDQRGDVLHYFGGRGFGKLGPEYVNHFTFMKACICPECNMTKEYNWAHGNGWWKNVSTTSKMTELPWYHLIFDERYAQQVDVYEGALNHARSTYRSENQSVMGAAHVYYYNTISREEIVRRILTYADETYTFDKFVAKDKMELPEE